MKRFNKIYIEISNVCNLACAFCPGTKREQRFMSLSEFEKILQKVVPYTDYIYFHLMGEPLVHPKLEAFLSAAEKVGLRVIITTNGTLLCEAQKILLAAGSLHKVNVSLHAFEANDLPTSFSDYLDGCFAFGKAAAGEKLVVYRLWNQGGADEKNTSIIEKMKEYFPKPWVENWRGARIADKVYLEHGDKFDWPDIGAKDGGENVFCYGLRDQIGILADGTVVPCCLDHEGDIALGNIFKSDFSEIVESDRAKRIVQGFAEGRAAEELCRKCGYAREKFKK